MRIVAGGEEIEADLAVNCGGLQSDRLARLDGVDPGLRIVPFRGDYHRLVPSRAGLVKNLIYPVPDPRFPFLGVHFTRMIGGGAEAGPNAVPALAREGYAQDVVRPPRRVGVVHVPGLLASRRAGTWAWASARCTAPSASGRS